MPKSESKSYPLLEAKQIEIKQFASFIRAAIKRNDAAAIVAATKKLGRVKDKTLAMVMFQFAFDAKTTKDAVAVGLALQELAMAARQAPDEAFGNALCYLNLIHTKAKYFDPELTRRWLDRVVPRGPSHRSIFHDAAELYVDLGDNEAALRMVAGALLYGYDKAAELETNKDLAPLFSDRRFKKLFAKTSTQETYRAAFAGGGAKRAASARNEDLERAILVDPTAVEPYLIYGDWLQQQGDPRGELIAIQHARLKSPRSRALKKREAEMLKQHAAQLRGTSAITWTEEEDAMDFEWHLGFVRRARFKYVSYSVEDNHIPPLEDIVRDFFKSASGRFVQELIIGVYEPGDDHGPVIKALVATGPHEAVRSLVMAERTHEESELSWVELGKLGALWRTFPKLEKLTLEAGQFELGEIASTSLREVEIRTSGLSLSNLRQICAAKWPQLEKLRIWFGCEQYGSKAKVADLQPLLDGVGLPKLTYLGLMNAELTNELAAVLPRAKILRQLTTLDLSMGTLTHEGLATLIAGAPAFKHLAVLDLSSNHLEGKRDPRASKLAKRVVFSNQRPLYDFLEESGGRYVEMGE